MDVTGRLMDEQVINNNNTATFSVKDHAPGMYLYQVITNGKTQTGKVLIERQNIEKQQKQQYQSTIRLPRNTGATFLPCEEDYLSFIPDLFL
jgi:hypothetical protein